jgi:hypothetical protein
MSEYATEEIAARNRHTGSLSSPLYLMAPTSEEPNEYQRKLISFPEVTRSSTLTHRGLSTTDIWGGQGTITAINYATNVSSSTLTAITCFAHVATTEYLDSRNIAISNLGLGVQNVLWSNESTVTVDREPSHPQVQSVLLSDEVLLFCSRWQIFHMFQRALRLVQQSFHDLRSIEVQVEGDPESEEEWLVILVKLHCEIEAVLSMYDIYTKGFVRTVPWPVRDKIRLVYDLV